MMSKEEYLQWMQEQDLVPQYFNEEKEGMSYMEYIGSLDVDDKGNTAGDENKTFSFTITPLPRWKSIILGFLNRIENWIIKL